MVLEPAAVQLEQIRQVEATTLVSALRLALRKAGTMASQKSAPVAATPLLAWGEQGAAARGGRGEGAMLSGLHTQWVEPDPGVVSVGADLGAGNSASVWPPVAACNRPPSADWGGQAAARP